jgi:ubiquinone/menaquinone biosynthesis C-methylase UbiE
MATPTIEQAHTRADAAQGSRFSALIYDPILWWAERSGMAERRRRLLDGARGRVLEIGAGTGLNMEYYPADLDRLVMAEPELHMARRLERRLRSRDLRAEVIRAPAEVLPFDDGAFDTVVSTLVLCTVEEPMAALREICRVLHPEGSLLFLEHVRADSFRLARWQQRLHDPWQSFADGCNCDRRTLENLQEAGFSVSVRERARWRRMPPIVHPLISGQARPQ